MTAGPSGARPIANGGAAGSERILLVDDRSDVRAALRRTLESCGYSVIEAANAAAALQIAMAESEPIDLLLADVVMPKMSGIELAEQLAELRPGLKVLFMSGHLNHPTLRERELPPGSVLLPKPFPPTELRRSVRDILDQPAT